MVSKGGIGLALLAIHLLSGCQSYLGLIDGLNKRQIQSCLEYNGSATLGAAAVFSGQGALHGITATGGANMEMCRDLLE